MMAILPAMAGETHYVNFVRQKQQATSIVWDMPVDPFGAAPSQMAIEKGGSLFQLWTIETEDAKDYLLDQKFVDAYLATADITITTLDPYARHPRTRIDQPFTVTINVNGLLTGANLPLSSKSVLLERHIANYPLDPVTQNLNASLMDPAKVTSGTPYSSAYLSQNGATVLKFPASALKATDPTKATGEEHFVVHSLTDANVTQTQIASAFVQILPIASGAIKGIASGDSIGFQIPQIELLLNDLYPRSDTYLLLFDGSQTSGTPKAIVTAFPMDREKSESHVLRVTGLDSKITTDGTYTLALVSDTVYGRELLTDPVTFSINRTLQVNAMQVNFSNEANP